MYMYVRILIVILDVAESLTRNLKEAQAKKELEEHDFRNQINSLLRKIEQLENTITEERAIKKVIFQTWPV